MDHKNQVIEEPMYDQNKSQHVKCLSMMEGIIEVKFKKS